MNALGVAVRDLDRRGINYPRDTSDKLAAMGSTTATAITNREWCRECRAAGVRACWHRKSAVLAILNLWLRYRRE